MNILILTEGGKNIGFGHITRCIALYQAFKEKGITAEIVINGDETVKDLFKDVNYCIFNWLIEKGKTFKMINGADIVILDSYLADSDLYKKLPSIVKIPVYIDDNNRVKYPSGIVVNGNIAAEDLCYSKKNGVIYLLGSKYTPLRKIFWNMPEKKIKKKIRSIMITFGGDDVKNMTPKILKFLREYYPTLKKNVIIGRAFKNIKEIKRVAGKNKNINLIYHPDAKKMKQVMIKSDIAISAGGQTLYELARIGVPTIGICVAENQSRSLMAWYGVGFIEYVGLHGDFLSEINTSLKKIEDKEERDKRSKIAKRCVDGKGVSRIINCILENLK